MPKKTKLSDLIPDDKNFNRGNEYGNSLIEKSFRKFGAGRSILIDKNNRIIAGNKSVENAAAIGLEDVQIIETDGKKLIAVKRTDIDLDSPEGREMALADNASAKANIVFDAELVEAELGEAICTEWGIETSVKLEAQEDDFEAPEGGIETDIVLGDLFEIGQHRLLCGDSTDSDAVERLMDGKKADMVFTDPPYNIASDSKNVAANCSRSMYKLSKSEWDKNFDINELFPCLFDAMAEDCTVYICTSHFLAGDIWKWMKEWADHYSYCVWSKPNPMPSLTKRHWTWNTELICYATRGKHIFHFPKEGHALSTWTINRKNGVTAHPTEKPVEVPSKAISFSSNERQCVLDLFGGSGSTLIACEQLNRTCYMMELDPKYCQVIIDRMQKLDPTIEIKKNGQPYAKAE